MTPIQRYLIHYRNRLRQTAGAAYAAGKRAAPAPHLGKRAQEGTDPAPLRPPDQPRSPWGTHDEEGRRIPDPGASIQPLRETPKVVIQPQPKAYGAPSYQVYAWGVGDTYGDLLNPAASQMSALRDAYGWAIENHPLAAVEVVLYEETPGPRVAPASRWLI